MSPVEEPLPRQVQLFIVLLALLQALALWIVWVGVERDWPLLGALGTRVCWYTLVLSVPTAMALSVQRLDDARFWQNTALVGVVFLALGAWVARAATGAPGLEASAVLTPFAISMAAALFVAGPFLQCRQAHGRWCAPYPELFAHAWQNLLTLLVAGFFTGICWAVLGLWAGLFTLIGVEFFADLFTGTAFAYLATGLFAGLGVLVGRSQARPVQVMRRLLIAIFTGLFPLLAAIAVLFVVTLPFTGLEPLWSTRSAATVLMALLVAMVVFANAVYQDGDDPAPYPRPLRVLAAAGLVVLPVFAVLALVALGLRVGQYGWSVERIWAAIAAAILTVHAFGYAWAALDRRGRWLARIEPVNVTAALAGLLLVLLANSPVLDPQRIAAASQAQRLLDGRTRADDFDEAYLRYRSGRAGYKTLQGLSKAPQVTSNAGLADRIERALLQTERYQPWNSDGETTATGEDRASLQPGAIPVIGPEPETGWWDALAARDLDAVGCGQPGSDCIAIVRDLDADGVLDVLLCHLGVDHTVHCRVHARENGIWYDIAPVVMFDDGTRKLSGALRRGEVTLVPRRWPDLEVAGQRSAIEDPSAEPAEPVAAIDSADRVNHVDRVDEADSADPISPPEPAEPVDPAD
ncbi:DUF4153 domain-containing protein [Novilysobacter avium]|uniref:DUF4153 domain-containing protein n=1 Tax=Novilysobacter avium TaxID=2781023 RepID=A0A7S6ZUQ8_9GAMM|nr:DUF4153 domain-containing protein [Lysobacter avium]QOW21934.1 DUF4153 domain-containing protein [Lysobacter avium]